MILPWEILHMTEILVVLHVDKKESVAQVEDYSNDLANYGFAHNRTYWTHRTHASRL